MGCHALLQGIFPTQGSNPGLSHCRRILYHLSHQGSPWLLEWVAYPFYRGTFQPRNWGLLPYRWILYQLSYPWSPLLGIYPESESESEVAQSCLTLCNPVDCSLPGSSVHGIFQARVLEWVAIAFSQGIFLTQGSNPDLLHCRLTLYPLSHQGSPYMPWENHNSKRHTQPMFIAALFTIARIWKQPRCPLFRVLFLKVSRMWCACVQISAWPLNNLGTFHNLSVSMLLYTCFTWV